MYQYKRIMDIKEFTFDSLETLCTREAVDGWRVVTISDGSMHRYATLEKEITNERTNSSGTNSTPANSSPGISDCAVVTRVKRGKAST